MRSRSDDDNVFGILKPKVRRETLRGLSAQENAIPDAAPNQVERARRTTSRMQPAQKGDGEESEPQTGGLETAAQAHTNPPQPTEEASAHAMQRRSGERRTLERANQGGPGTERLPGDERITPADPGLSPSDPPRAMDTDPLAPEPEIRDSHDCWAERAPSESLRARPVPDRDRPALRYHSAVLRQNYSESHTTSVQ